MIEFGGLTYYIDFDELDKLVGSDSSLQAQEVLETDTKIYLNAHGEKTGEEIKTRKYFKSKEIDGSKFEIINLMLRVVMDNYDHLDATLGSDRALEGTTLNYKIAFNTLIKYGVLKEQED